MFARVEVGTVQDVAHKRSGSQFTSFRYYQESLM